MKAFLLCAAIALSAVLAGCATQENRCASLPGGGQYCLQPSTSVVPFDVQQKVTATFHGHSETLISEIEVHATGVRFVGLTPFGHKLLDLEYDNHVVTVHTLPDRRLNATLLMALLQIAQWPEDSVRVGLSPSVALQTPSPNQRLLATGGETVVIVRHSAGLSPHQQLHIALPGPGLVLDMEALPSLDATEAMP